MHLISVLLLTYSSFVLAATYTVGVGKDENTGQKGIGFDPSVINPVTGDTIVFEFRSGKHSVVQSSFSNPCTPSGGFDSGVQQVDDNLSVDASGLPTVNVLVNDTQPLWFFDQAAGSCNQGGVLAVNPTADQTAPVFKDNASKATVAPLSSPVSSNSISTSGVSDTSTSASAASPSSISTSSESNSAAPDRTFGPFFTVVLAAVGLSGMMIIAEY